MSVGVEEVKTIVESMKQDIIDNERKRIAELIEDMYTANMTTEYEVGFNTALMRIHDKIIY